MGEDRVKRLSGKRKEGREPLQRAGRRDEDQSSFAWIGT